MRLMLKLMFFIFAIVATTCWGDTEKEPTPNDYLDPGKNIHGFFQLGTDHVWRGISFSNHLPEVFGAMLYSLPRGVYGGVVSYDTMLSNGGIGVAPILGIKGEQNKLSYDLSARYEFYPKPVPAVTPNMFEVYGELGYEVLEYLKLVGGLGYSPNYYFKSGTGIYVNGLALISLPKNIKLEAGLGYQDTQRGGQPDNLWFKNYLNWVAGVRKEFSNQLNMGFRYTQTNLNDVECLNLNVCGPAYNLFVQKVF